VEIRLTITLIRHAKVNYEFKKYCRHSDFEKSCLEYDNSPIFDFLKHNRATTIANTIYISGLRRTYDTSKLLFPDKTPTENKLFDEIPIKAFAPLPFPIPTAVWFGIGRLQWLFGMKKQPEPKKTTKIRVQKAVDILVASGEDVVLIGHGLLMRLLVKELKRRGFLLEGEASYNNLDYIRLRI